MWWSINLWIFINSYIILLLKLKSLVFRCAPYMLLRNNMKYKLTLSTPDGLGYSYKIRCISRETGGAQFSAACRSLKVYFPAGSNCSLIPAKWSFPRKLHLLSVSDLEIVRQTHLIYLEKWYRFLNSSIDERHLANFYYWTSILV